MSLDFKQTRIRVEPIRVETGVESTEVLKTVNEKRKYVCLSCPLPGTMEAQKTMKSWALIQKVVWQLFHRFSLNISNVKKLVI